MKRKAIIILCGLLVLAGLSLLLILPKDAHEQLENLRTSSVVYDRNGEVIGNLGYSSRIWTPLEDISPQLQQAVVAIEDSRFNKHNGIDLKGIARAVWHNLIPGGALEGGSTITQQLAKTALLSSERTLLRKVQDIALALQIELTYSKNDILELYLNSIYLAHGNVGVEAASRYLFNKSAAELNLSEAAMIAGMIRSPENYSPVKNPDTAKQRRDLVLRKMLEHEYITKSDYNQAVATKFASVDRKQHAKVGNYFLDYVKEYLIEKEGLSEAELRYGGYQIYTTLDLQMQQAAEAAMLKLPKIESAQIQPQGALVSLDADTGGILAMVGGRSYAQTQYNRSVKSYRQPGSAIKPFVYATALGMGYTAASRVTDQPLSITLENGTVWEPENYDHIYLGEISLREALRYSVNTVAVQLVQDVGVEPVANQMEAMGISSLVQEGTTSDLNLAPLALGGLTTGVTPLELTAAYLPFANQGVFVEAIGIEKIVDHDGKVIKEYLPEQRQVLSEENAYIMTKLLQDAVEQGTGYRAKIAGHQVAGKTGTSNDYTNAWFVGYTPQIVTTIWIGNDRQDAPMSYQTGNIGSSAAAQLWNSYMTVAMDGMPELDFQEPEGVVWANVDPETGMAITGVFNKNTYKEVFSVNNIPASKSYKFWSWFSPSKRRRVKESEGVTVTEEATPTDDFAEEKF